MKKRNILTISLGILAFTFLSLQTSAQETLPNSKGATILLSSHKASLSGNDTTFTINVMSNANYTITPSANWISVRRSGLSNNVFVTVERNWGLSRTATIAFTDSEGKATRVFNVEQARENTAEYIIGDTQVKVASGTATSFQSASENINASFDGNYGTIYHSSYNNSAANYFPITLTYNFTNVEQIDYLVYHPRQSGSNGRFREVEVWYKRKDDSDYIKHGDYNFQGSSTASTVSFPGGLMNPTSIKFVVKSGNGSGQGFASCAEMEFFKRVELVGDFAVFENNLMTSLKSTVTQATLDTLTNPFCKLLAQNIFDGNYTTEYRVNKYECLLSPSKLSEMWSTPGKLYDQLQGVTGINMTKGKHVVIVEGLSDAAKAGLTVVAWYDGDGKNPNVRSFPLKNGINVINYVNSNDGIAYITYYDDDPTGKPEINVHFANGQINGYLSPDKTNDEMDIILAKATNRCIDLLGSTVHSVWEAQGMRNYCKATDGVSKGYRQYMNILDTLVTWQHRLMGLHKYNQVPKNKTMAYVNYTYYMFQGAYGVSFINTQQSRVLNCRTITYNDDDAIWGLSHEWGHQHQMQPYFCWAGLGESSNNMKSCYNVLHMGYPGSRITNGWNTARNNILREQGLSKYSLARRQAYQRANQFNWCEEIRQLALSMSDSLIYKVADNPDKAISISEVNVESNLAPFFMLHSYFSTESNHTASKDFYLPDYSPDLYESLRQTDVEDDKYAILAAAQNAVAGKYNEFKTKYPTSVWIERNYILSNSSRWQNSTPFIFNYCRKASKISGYNLYPFFEKWGFFRTVAMAIDDYGYKYIALTPEMKNEFKADMDALVTDGTLKVISEELMETISMANIPRYQTPTFPN